MGITYDAYEGVCTEGRFTSRITLSWDEYHTTGDTYQGFAQLRKLTTYYH